MIIDPNLDLEPQARNRCNTWPLRPIIDDPPSIQDSESNHAEVTIKEEGPSDFAAAEIGSESPHNISGGPDHLTISNQIGITNSSELGSQGDLNNTKKQSARKNAWGNLSYADLITQAIQSSPEKRLTLSQIYDWMVQNVGYFRDKGDSNSSAGWKNSIRHNLSLHNRFMRIQNEGAGKSSWWVINPDAKPGKAPRRPRGNSMDSKSMSMKATRDRAMKRVRERNSKGLLGKDGTISPVSPAHEFTLSPGDGGYRDRASSFASNISGRKSPVSDFDLDAKLSPYGSENRLEFEYSMDTSGKLPDELELLGINFPNLPSGSLLDELEETNEPYNDPGSSGLPPHNVFSGKPYSTYLQINEGGATYSNQPPPPYPDQQQYNQAPVSNPQLNMQNRYKDPMITSYAGSGGNSNNNTLSPSLLPRVPQYVSRYSNGVVGTQNASAAPQQQQQQQQRVNA
ncbi:hypothetical protein EB796_002762 [Bugula neritina]|uniref:Forkhead box protein O n=1 Tax=Bugula neritina TaxID=10212 RepID=A0A7J7KLP5_BUGNE|nr:hypothetical protein EB796_002762 [Bugula neritina]